jgi:hypothetical protein
VRRLGFEQRRKPDRDQRATDQAHLGILGPQQRDRGTAGDEDETDDLEDRSQQSAANQR